MVPLTVNSVYGFKVAFVPEFRARLYWAPKEISELQIINTVEVNKGFKRADG